MLSGTAGLSKMGPFHTRPRLLYGCDAAKYIHNYYGDSAGSKEIGEICFGQQGAAVLTTHSISRQNKLGISLPSVMTNADTFPSMGHSTDQPIYPIDCRLPGSKGTAPICQDPLAQDFGHMSVQCPAAQAVLTGNYHNPHPDDAMEDLFNEIADTWTRTNKTPISTIITRQDWQAYWIKADERTSSSASGLHFGHCKAATSSKYLSHYRAAKTTVALTLGSPFDRWKRGVTVMLEKERGVNLVSKLRAILLMEADFNAANKMIFGNRMLSSVRANSLMPEEIFSEKGCTAVDGTLAKVLFYDISRQFRKPAAIASVDASNCFDRICHAMTSLVFKSVGVPQSAVTAMLGAIAEMKFFLRTAFGDSEQFAGGGIEYKTRGMCQGNGAAPDAWGVVSITILKAHNRRHSGASFLCPISATRKNVAGILFVDDTDLMHIDMTKPTLDTDIHYKMEASIHNWGRLLLATGGALKREKCSYTLISYAGDANSNWHYYDYSENDDFRMRVPAQDGRHQYIDHHPVSYAQKTLGILTSPNGSNRHSCSTCVTENVSRGSSKTTQLAEYANTVLATSRIRTRIQFRYLCGTLGGSEETLLQHPPFVRCQPQHSSQLPPITRGVLWGGAPTSGNRSNN